MRKNNRNISENRPKHIRKTSEKISENSTDHKISLMSERAGVRSAGSHRPRKTRTWIGHRGTTTKESSSSSYGRSTDHKISRMYRRAGARSRCPLSEERFGVASGRRIGRCRKVFLFALPAGSPTRLLGDVHLLQERFY